MQSDFIEELIREAEAREEKQSEAYFDLLLMNIRQMQQELKYNFEEAEKECSMINSFVLNKNAQIQERMRWLEIKLEAFIKERGVKTLALPTGTLKMHKKPDRIEIEDLELFLKKAKPEMLTIIPEQVKPDLNKIKNYIKSRQVPPGVKVIEGQEEFSYKLNGKEDADAGKEEVGAGSKSDSIFRAAV